MNHNTKKENTFKLYSHFHGFVKYMNHNTKNKNLTE